MANGLRIGEAGLQMTNGDDREMYLYVILHVMKHDKIGDAVVKNAQMLW